MRIIDADALMDDIKRDSKKAIDEGDKVGSFWLGYAAGLVIKLPTIQPEKAQLSQEDATSDMISRQAALDAVEKNACNTQRIMDAVNNLPPIQPVATDTNVGDAISKFIDGLEEIFADIRERHVDDSVCGLCEYDGAYMGQSGDWCNECPGFNRDDCFKLSEETRKKWTEEIIKALPSVQPEPAIPLSWIEKYIEWLKSFDNEFANLEAAHISVMVKKWRDEQNERTD